MGSMQKPNFWIFCCCLWWAVAGCGSGNNGNSAPIAPIAYNTYTISGTIYWAAGDQTDSDVNDPGSTPSYQINDSFEEAQPLSSPAVVGGYVNAPGQGPDGRSYNEGDASDFYSVNLQTGDIVRLVLPDENQSNIVQLHLYEDSNAEPLDSLTLTDGQNQRLVVDTAGNYAIEIRALSGGTNYRLMVGAPYMRDAMGAPAEFVPGEVLVKFKSRAAQSPFQTRAAFARGLGMKPAGGVGRWMRVRAGDMAVTFKGLNIQTAPRTHAGLGVEALHQAMRQDTLRLVSALSRHPDVAYAQPNYIRRAFAFEPNDPLYPYQWNYSMIHLPEAWGLTDVWGAGNPPGSGMVIVAVVDSGILSGHPDLAGKLVAGYDFVSDAGDNDRQTGSDPDPTDPGGGSGFHGTHVAGTIAAAFDNGIGVAGVGGATRIMPVRVLGPDGGTDLDIARGIRWAAGDTSVTDENNLPVAPPAQRADIINLSMGGYDTAPILEEAIAFAYGENGDRTLLIGAAGNEGINAPSYPAAYPQVVSVGAVNARAQTAFYSNYGSTISLVAPGGDLYADVQSDGYGDGVLSTLGDESTGEMIYGFFQGTSMAAPHVAGVAALMKAVNPVMTPADFEAYIQAGDISADLGTPGRDDLYGFGLIDAFKAVAAAGGLPSAPVISALPAALHIDAFTDSAQVALSPVGSGSIVLDSPTVDESGTWLSVQRAADQEADPGGFGQYTVSIDRTGLSGGVHRSFVRFTAAAAANTLDVPVTIDVLPDTTASAAMQYLVLMNAETNQRVAQRTIRPNGGVYTFTFYNIPEGNYYLACGSDLDNDGYITDEGEAVGYYPDMTEASFTLQSNLNGVRFITSFSNNAFTLSSGVLPQAEKWMEK